MNVDFLYFCRVDSLSKAPDLSGKTGMGLILVNGYANSTISAKIKPVNLNWVPLIDDLS